jgi:5-methyltetrahydrofolate--homocysteine methyltransferase
MVDFSQISQCIVEGGIEKTKKMTREGLQAKIPAEVILNKALIPGIRKTGELFGAGEYFLPELLMAGKAMSAAMEILEPELSKANMPPAGNYLIGSVKGDVHDIGKNIVVMMLRANGWKVTDLGVDVSPEDFCREVSKGSYQILGMSALLTSTMAAAQETINALRQAGTRDRIKIMVGGAPTSREWATRIGADAHASDAADAVTIAEALVRK